MKKTLLFIVLGIAMIQFANAQVIELTGKGVYGDNPSELIIPDPGSVEKVVVVAAATFTNWAVPADVTFSDSDESFTVEFMATDPTKAPGWILAQITSGEFLVGYYTAEFTTVDGDGKITLENYGQEESIKSFTAYIYRTPVPGIYSEMTEKPGYAFRNTSADPLEYTFIIPESDNPRDVVVSVPFTDLESNPEMRYAQMVVTAGAQSAESAFNTNNSGDLLRIETLTLENVPGTTTEVTVTIFSPYPPYEPSDEYDGDSFITGPVLLSTTYGEQGGGCTLTQGYWKTHSKYGPARPADPTWDLIGPDTEFFSSGKSYIKVLKTSPKGNKYYILAHQYIAAELNFLKGASNSAIIEEFNQATAIFNTYTPSDIAKLKGWDGKKLEKYIEKLAGKLDDYNNGEIGPGHCEEEEEKDDECDDWFANDNDWNHKGKYGNNNHGKNNWKGNRNQDPFDLKIYPNPVIQHGKIEFTPVDNGRVTVELFSFMGFRRAILYNKKVNKGRPVSFSFQAHKLPKGSYVVVVKNGWANETYHLKIGK